MQQNIKNKRRELKNRAEGTYEQKRKKVKNECSHLDFFSVVSVYIVGCQGDAQLVGLVLGRPQQFPLRLRLENLFYPLKVPLQFEIKNNWLIQYENKRILVKIWESVDISLYALFLSVSLSVSLSASLFVNLSVSPVVLPVLLSGFKI